MALVMLVGGTHAQGDVAGTWRGRIELPGSPLEVEVILQRENDAWGGAIDTCSRFSVMFGRALGGRAVFAVGYTGLVVAASRFGAISR
jgi:hypothetical protein